ncbi:CCAAT/enhancer-binding protein gamma-like [Littorina saxatilis]|uniref:BZIP domain-containing protein n=1 Tax=Littorina saxatilis TaxID=31220 RepID=A0AAN9AL80_9CAEN
MAPRKMDGNDNQGSGRGHSKRGSAAPKEGEDYKKRRERNNIAVRKSRQLSRQKAKVTEEKVSLLRSENKNLEQKVKLLTKELGVLKDLFLSTAAPAGGQSNVTEQEADILQELQSVEADHKYSMPE